MNWRKRIKKGFTLVELLVVIGIIALLIAILMPALSRARKQALQASCGSNERQVTYGALAYANDWKEQLPTRFGNLSQALRGWSSASLSAFARLPIVGFDSTTVWDWGTYLISGTALETALGGWSFVMRDYLKNDFDIYVCPDGWYTRSDFIIKWDWTTQGLGAVTGYAVVPGLYQYRSGYIWLPHRSIAVEVPAFTCGGPVADQDTPGQIAKTASDKPDLLIMADFNIFTNRPDAGCGLPGNINSCGVGANHNTTSFKQLPLIANACTPEVFPPNIGRRENPDQMPLGMNRARIDARTTWLPWQDWEYFKSPFGWAGGTRDWWHSF